MQESLPVIQLFKEAGAPPSSPITITISSTSASSLAPKQHAITKCNNPLVLL